MLTEEQCITAIREKLSHKRFIHSLNVADEAEHLAKKWGADPERARIAGLLHDIMKDTPPEEQLQILAKFGIMLDNVQKKEGKLLHAITGAAYIERVLRVDDPDIVNAVRYHTTGRRGMTILEKVLFLADFISADRDYEGVEPLRNAVSRGLKDGMLQSLQFTIGDLAARLCAIHPDTVDAYNEEICGG